jgi:hypothetical protein
LIYCKYRDLDHNMKIGLVIPGYTNIPAPSGVPSGGLAGGTGTNAISVFIVVVIIIGILFALWNIMLGGLQMIFSRGIKEKVKSARDKTFFGIIGLVLLLFSVFFVQILGAAIGIDILP